MDHTEKTSAGIVVQCRLGSTRLPGKVLKSVWRNYTLLDMVLDRLSSFRTQHQVILATSDGPQDDPLVYEAERRNMPSFRGSETDVLSRFVAIGQDRGFTHVIRVCADNPLLSKHLVQSLLDQDFLGWDYLSFYKDDVPLIKMHLGLGVEVASTAALHRAMQVSTDPMDREHVTPYIYSNEEEFRVKRMPLPPMLNRMADRLRFTVDDETDLSLVQSLLSHFNDYEQILNLDFEGLLSLLKPTDLTIMQDQMIRYRK
ncbi:MAG: hypothetical protein KTR24_13880 [Saprospiraceae bacterium]|nr:hypothetical protein [Saprospiraceae bacterium]